VSASEDETAARLLERLLSDPDYRAAFRADPVAASHSAGLDGVARELAADRGKVMQTLDGRESRSSLAGVLLAAALEGSAIVDFSQRVLPHLDEVPRAVGDVLAGLSPLGVEDAQAATPQRAAVEPVAGEFRAISADEAAAARAPGVADILHNPRVSFDADGIADLRAGRVDPRLVSVLGAVTREHKISISVIASGHDKLTSGGSVSNHYYGRALDISVVDGSPVSPANSAARELAVALSRLPASIRPTEIGSPWALPGAAYFTDGAHQNHVHVGFDDPVPAGWRPPAGTAPAGDEAAVEIPAAGAPAVEIPAVDVDEEDAEPGGLEDPGGDTDAEADAESDGDGGDEDDSVADDPSDEQENDEESDESDGDDGDDGDHDDNSDSGSDDLSDSDSSDGGEDDDDSDGDAVDGGDGDAGGGDGAPIDLGDVGGSYPGDNASQAELATWMGAAAQRRGLPPELPVMAALVESHLKNLGYGDADSVGFFQMRLGTWNSGDYAGYPERPGLQLKWFLDQAEAVKRQRAAAGKPLGAASYGDWIADIERPAAQYRGRYQPQLAEARELLRRSARVGGGHDGGAHLEQVVDAGGPTAGPRALAAVHEARKYLGTPYQWGGSTPQTGFDCSGLMQWAYAKAGIRIPRTTYEQIAAANGRPVGRHDLQPGDLIFFSDSSGDVHHVGMSLGGDRFIQAPHTGDVVKTSSLKESYYAEQFTSGRRFDLSAPSVRAAAAGDGGDAAATPSVDSASAQEAEAALLRDAAEAQRPGTLMFEAVRAQELPKLRSAESA
jgi:cell wall-associated NlpC family hydrolase